MDPPEQPQKIIGPRQIITEQWIANEKVDSLPLHPWYSLKAFTMIPNMFPTKENQRKYCWLCSDTIQTPNRSYCDTCLARIES